MRETEGQAVVFSSGGVGRALREACRLKTPDSPRLPAYFRHGLQIYAALSIVVGPDTAVCHLPIHSPFAPFLAVACYI
jgi:hypothetical protein